MKKILFVLIIAVLSTPTTAQNNVKQKEEQKKLMDVNRAWAKTASPEQFFSFISTDVLLLAPDKKTLRGHEEFGRFLDEMYLLPGFQIKWEPQSAVVSTSGDLGYTVDRIRVTYDDENGNKVDLFEKGVTIWQKDEEGNWKLSVDIWNVDPSITSIYQ